MAVLTRLAFVGALAAAPAFAPKDATVVLTGRPDLVLRLSSEDTVIRVPADDVVLGLPADEALQS